MGGVEDKDWDHQFERLVESIDLTDLSDPRAPFTLWDINRAILGMSEASMYLTRWIGQFLQHEEEMIFPEELVDRLREVIKLTDTIADGLIDCNCPECVLDDEEEEED